MKNGLLLNNYIPSFKLGAETLGVAAFGLGTSIFGSELQNQSASSENRKNRDWQSKEAEKQREWQEHMYDRSIDEWQNQYDQQREEWYKQLQAQYGAQWEQFVKQAEYNSPKMQVQRLAEAGINPSAALGNGSAGGLMSASSLGSQASPAPPSGGTLPAPGAGASAGTPAQFNPVSARSEMISSIGGFLRDLSSAAKTSEEAKQVQDMALAQIRKLIADEQWQKSITDFQSIQNDIAKFTKNAKVHQSFADLGNAYVDIALKISQGELYDEEILNKKVTRAVLEVERDLKNKQGQLLGLQIVNYDENFRAELALKKAMTNQANASSVASYFSGELFSALANTENSSRMAKLRAYDLDVDMASLRRDILRDDKTISNETVIERIKKMVSEAKSARLLTDEQVQRINLLEKDNSWYNAKSVMDIFESFSRIVHNFTTSISDAAKMSAGK